MKMRGKSMNHVKKAVCVATNLFPLVFLFFVGCANPTNSDSPSSPGSPTEIAAPVVSPSGGSITSATKISITCPSNGATILYTTDGTDPSEKSGTIKGNKYSSPFTLPQGTTTLKAMAYKTGCTDSSIVSDTLTITAPIVYVGGYYTTSSGGPGYACYWKDGVETDLACGS